MYLGNGLNEYRDYDRAAGYLKTIKTDPGLGASIQNLAFTYDEVGNMLTRADGGIGKTETFTYDALHRLATSQVSGYGAVTLNYSAAGRITSKSDVGSYLYTGTGGPHAVNSAGGVSYGYDANGRMTSRAGSAITWTSYDLAKTIASGGQSTEFAYGVERVRYKQVQKTGGTTDATILYVGRLLERETRGGTTTWRHHVEANGRTIAIVERVGTTNTTRYLHRDHQGSVVKVTNAAGGVVETLAFDAWGLRRDPTNWSALGSPFAGSHTTERGYTGHEHLGTVGLVHMNGRVQDPALGRFLSADPLVQSPYNTQSHNRYSYVWNNPARFTDPSGFCAQAQLWMCVVDPGQAYEVYTDGIIALQNSEAGMMGLTGFLEDQLHMAWSMANANYHTPTVRQGPSNASRRGAAEEHANALIRNAAIDHEREWHDPDDAARYILPIIHSITRETGLELGGFLYSRPRGTFSIYPEIFVGTRTQVPQMSPPFPPNLDVVAGFHSHPTRMIFSVGDVNWAEETGKLLYLVNPRGEMSSCIGGAVNCSSIGLRRNPGSSESLIGTRL